MEVADPKRFFTIVLLFVAAVSGLVWFFFLRSDNVSAPSAQQQQQQQQQPTNTVASPKELTAMYKALQDAPKVVVTGFVGKVRNKVVIDKSDNRLIVYTNGQLTLYVNDSKRYDYDVAKKCFVRTVLPSTDGIIKEYSSNTLTLPLPDKKGYNFETVGEDYKFTWQPQGQTVTVTAKAATSLPSTVDITGTVSQKKMFKYPTTVPVVEGTKKCN